MRSLLDRVDALAGGIKHEARHQVTASPAPRRWRLADRLGEQIIHDVLRDSREGATQRWLAERYGISVSSVKRLLHNAQAAKVSNTRQ
jgi:hypothetical protein